jgi:predicted AAA+ superfamily ATPase
LNNGRALENAVFIELRRKSYDIFYYSNKKECDFIIRNGITPVLAIQVVYELTEDNFQRELEGLKEAMSDLNIERGQLICMHPNKFSFEDESIEMILAWKWFLNY